MTEAEYQRMLKKALDAATARRLDRLIKQIVRVQTTPKTK